MKKYDIIIIGAGLVGTSIALALQNQGFNLLLLEKNLPESITTSDNKNDRPISLAYASQQMLAALQVWDQLEATAMPIAQVHVSEQGAFGHINFSAKEQGLKALGYVVSFQLLQRSLYEMAAKQKGVEIKTIIELKSIDLISSAVVFSSIEGDQRVLADLIIAADGAGSDSKELLNINTQTKDHGEFALIFQLEMNSSHNQTAYERFTQDGVVAFLPLHDQRRAQMVWTLNKKKKEEVLTWNDDALKLFFESVFGSRVGKINDIKKGASFPLKTSIATQQIKHHFVLLGNAAHTIYPLAAQGFNLSLRDVALLAELIVEAKNNNQMIGDLNLLNEYIHARQIDQQNTQRLTGSLVDVFGLHVPGATWSRGLALLATEIIKPLKNRLAKQALGMAGKRPKLLRGLTL